MIRRYCRRCGARREFVDHTSYDTGVGIESWHCVECNWKLPRNPAVNEYGLPIKY